MGCATRPDGLPTTRGSCLAPGDSVEEESGDQYDIRAIRVSDGKEIPLVVTAEDEREADWYPGR